MNEIKTDKLLEIGIALSREKDDDRLLGLILHEAMEMTACDGGTLYIYDGESLRFHIMITKSMNVRKGEVVGISGLMGAHAPQPCLCLRCHGKETHQYPRCV